MRGRLFRSSAAHIAQAVAAAGLPKVDLLSIDTEGGELESLQTLAAGPLRPRVITVEENVPAEQLDRALQEMGYSLIGKVWPDRIYLFRKLPERVSLLP